MISKVKGIVLAVIISLSLASIMMPFTVYADTIDSTNIVGVNVELLGSSLLEHRTETVQNNTYNYYLNQYTYKAFIELDNSYVGVIGARVQGSYYDKAPSQGSTVRTESLNKYRKIYVNGNTAEMTFVITSWISAYDDPLIYRADGTSPSVSIEDSNVVKYEDIDSIEQIISLLGDIYQNSEDIEGLSTDQLGELESIVSNTSLSNQYLLQLSKFRQWNVPRESWPILINVLSNNLGTQTEFYQLDNYIQYPIFSISANGEIAHSLYFTKNIQYKFIFYASSAGAVMSLSASNSTLTINSVSTYDEVNVNGQYLRRYIVLMTNRINGTSSIIVPKNCLYIPIYFGYVGDMSVSTEFALQNGLSNRLLDNLDIIANGTTQSNSAASDLENEASEYSDIADDVIGVEEGLTSNFETSVNQIDLNTGLNGFGGNFMTSATWVRTQFDRLTENTPYGSLVVYGLTLGFVLLMLGKVLL